MVFEKVFRTLLSEDLLASASKSSSLSDVEITPDLSMPKDPAKQRTGTASTLRQTTNRVKRKAGEKLDPNRERTIDKVLMHHDNSEPLTTPLVNYIKTTYGINVGNIKPGDEKFLNSKTDTYITNVNGQFYVKNKSKHT